MLKSFAFSTFLMASLLAPPAFAADAVAPVKAVMDLAVANWASETGEGGGDYFDVEHIKNYSKAFRALYQKVEQHTADAGDDEGGGTFDYDPIQGSQDGCPLAELKIAPPAPAKGGVTDVAVTFKPYTCFDDDTKNAVAHLTFKVIDEGGKAVIDDVVRQDYYGSAPSLVEELKDALKN